MAVVDGLVYVLGGAAGGGEGSVVYRLKAKDGAPVPWPDGRLHLKIAALWPAGSVAAPEAADAMAVRHDRLYLTFTSAEFLAVLEAKTGAYLQTVVGAPPGLIDVAPTQTELPDAPGKLVDADFAVLTLRGGALGKVLFAHDPPWVVTSELSALEREERITALTVIGDGAQHHRHTAFIGLGAPFHQVQARPLLDTEVFSWVAGKAGGRPPLGPWQVEALRHICGVALAADGRLWVAEGEAVPPRFSVWETSGKQGRVVREFFAPVSPADPDAAVHPNDPRVLFARGCEWRLDPATGRVACLGVVTREPSELAVFATRAEGGVCLITSGANGGARIFERRGDGDYQPASAAPGGWKIHALHGGKIIVSAP